MKKKLIYTICILTFFLFVYFTKWECISRVLFNVTCPGCGMTRALKALIKLDIASAMYYNPMVLSLPLIYLYIINEGKVFKNKRINYACLALLIAGFLINHIIRLMIGLDI